MKEKRVSISEIYVGISILRDSLFSVNARNRGSPPLQMEVEADNRVGILGVQGGFRLLIWRQGRTEYYGHSGACRIDSRSRRLILWEFTDKHRDERHVGLILTIFSWKVGTEPRG